MSELGEENAAGGGSREKGSSRILMRGPGSPCDPWSPCLAAGSGQIPPGISILTDSVWIEIRVEFAQGPFLAGLPSGSAFLLSCRGTSLRTIAELARNWPGTASELPRKDGFTLVFNTFVRGQFLYTVRLIKILFKAQDVGTG